MDNKANPNNPLEIGPGTFWVGSGTHELLKRNVYLRVFRGNQKNFNLMIDPGPPVDIDAVTIKTAKIIGSLSNLHAVFANHQDPDVIGSAAFHLKTNPSLLFFMTEDTWRLAQYYGIPKKNYKPIEQFADFRIHFTTGQTLQFIPTPFCHFRGACMLYDPETRILFSGDLFGGIAASGLTATAANWAGIKAFHELYMPSKQALQLAVKRIRQLSPAPLMIAPQHGGIIGSDLIEPFLEKMNSMTVGLDIINSWEEKHEAIIEAVNNILKAAREMLGDQAVEHVMKFFQPDGSYPAIFTLTKKATVTDIKAEPFAAIGSLAKLLFKECSAEQKRPLQLKILVILVQHDLPPIESAIEWEEPVRNRAFEGKKIDKS